MRVKRGRRCSNVAAGRGLCGPTTLIHSTARPWSVSRGVSTVLRYGCFAGSSPPGCDDTMRAIEDGCLGDLVRPDAVDRYLPLAITLDIIPVEPFFYRTIEEAIAKRNALTHRKARALQVLPVSELELLEEYMAEGGSLAELLLENQTSVSRLVTSKVPGSPLLSPSGVGTVRSATPAGLCRSSWSSWSPTRQCSTTAPTRPRVSRSPHPPACNRTHYSQSPPAPPARPSAPNPPSPPAGAGCERLHPPFPHRA